MRQALKNARLRKNLTVRQISLLIGIKPSTYYKWEQGTRDPSHEHMKVVSEILSDNIDALFFDFLLDRTSKDGRGSSIIDKSPDMRRIG